MAANRKRTAETIVYTALWIIAVGLFLLDAMRTRAQLSEKLLDMRVLYGMARSMFPLFVLFVINNNVLIPRLLLKNRWKTYFAVTAIAVVGTWLWQYLTFVRLMESIPPGARPTPHPLLKPLIPLPVLLDFTYALLVVGGNLAIALMFQRFDDRLEKESLMKSNAENQLAYLKAQINPHFYMNMLNNIHGMIDIDAEKAQRMVLDMSNLMRYMLYDSSKPAIPLSDEIEFLDNYLNLMRRRYPADKVAVTSTFPHGNETRSILLPPLLFLVFIENAFKHGISYRTASFVAVSIEISADKIRFACVNSTHGAAPTQPDDEHSGIGLPNIRKRLRLLYGDKVELTTTAGASTYSVNLTIPAYDFKNPYN